MGYVPPKRPDFDRYTATLYTIASIADVGNQLLRQSGHRIRLDALPGTYDEYVRRLYGQRPRDWSGVLGYVMVMAVIALVVLLLAATR